MKKLLKYFFPVVLIVISLFLCFKNYTPGTYLIGWDSLHSEFNFPLNVSRMISHVWGGEMGVGAISAHSDMSDLPRILVLWLTSVFVPTSFIRYFYIFACLILGPLGVYFFLKYVFQREKGSLWVYPAAFLGALFYLLNLGTLQNFYVPLEMFTAAFAFTPWIAYLGLRYLKDGGRVNLIFWVAVLVLSSPMAYAATLWYASFAGLFIFFAFYCLVFSEKGSKFKRLFVMGLTAVLLNLYWILPNIYSVVNQSGVIANADINRLFSQEAFLRNRDYGNFANILLQKNFLFGWRNFDFAANQFTDLLGVWIKFLSNPKILIVGFSLAVFSVLGLITGVLKRGKTALALIPSLAFCLFFLVNINPPTGSLYSYLYNHFGVFAEGFRMPFTKFSVLYELIASFYFGYFVFVILTIRLKFLTLTKFIFILAVTTGLIYFTLPAFNGWLIGPGVRRTLPGEYQEVFTWFNSNPDGRVALLPINSKYGWEYRSWGYEGSGFLTYGIRNPILYRDFDRWSKYNEDFYTEASRGLYGNDPEGFLFTLKKYQVKYLLLDESIINPGGAPGLVTKSDKIREVAKFGFLTIYETNFSAGNDFISAPKSKIEKPTPILTKGDLLIKENLSVNRGFPEAYNCDLMRIGTVSKENSPEGILYKAKGGGVSCDYLNYPDLKYNQSYILHIVGENRGGRGLKIYFTNYKTQRADLEEIVPTGKFDLEFPISESLLDGAGYALNFETRSFGRIASENLVTKVEIYEATQSGGLTGVESVIQNNLVVLGVKKYGTWAYKVEVQGGGLIQLGQGYDKGWIAFELPKFEQFKHQKFNGWSNAWLIPSGLPFNYSIIYVVYWPQLLEWGGGVLGLITLLVLTLGVQRKWRQNP